MIVAHSQTATAAIQKNSGVLAMGKNIPRFPLVQSLITFKSLGLGRRPPPAIFCDDPDCDVVYFGDDGSTIVTSQLRTRIGVKEKADDSLICYCFGVCNSDFQHNPAIKGFVMDQTKAGLCSCETSNPSGRCCLKDFPKAGN